MKAVLVIDIADDVLECYKDLRIDYDLRGTPIDDDKVIESIKYVEDADVRRLLNRLDANDWHRMFSGLFSEREAKGYGWNACLDEILGGDENASEDV